MPSFDGGNLGLSWGFAAHEDGWGNSYNDNFKKLDVLTQLSVISSLASPPGSPANDAAYIIIATATGAWAGQETKLAVYTKQNEADARDWVFLTPKEGWQVWNKDTSSWWFFDGAAWTEVDSSPVPSGGTDGQVLTKVSGSPAWADPVSSGVAELDDLTDVDTTTTAPATNDRLIFDGTNWVPEKPEYMIAFSAPQTTAYTASQVVGHHDVAAAITIPANFGSYLGLSSRAGGSANTTGSTVFNVDQAVAATPNTWTTIGTITFASGTVTPTFATTGGTAKNIAADDRLRIVAPSSPDATFAGFYATITAKRQ